MIPLPRRSVERGGAGPFVAGGGDHRGPGGGGIVIAFLTASSPKIVPGLADPGVEL